MSGLLARPAIRSRVLGFFAPPAEVGRARSVPSSLPRLQTFLGPESGSLRTLREDTSAPGAPTAALTPRRTHLFESPGADDADKMHERYVRPTGLVWPEIVQHEDWLIGRAISALANEPRVRERFVAAMQRHATFSEEVARIARAWKMPLSLVAVAFVESAFLPTERTDPEGADALGVWQMTPQVAHVYGLAMLPNYDERRGVTPSTDAAMRYLGDLHERFGSWELTLVAYALGYDQTMRMVSSIAKADYAALAPSLPRETTAYVAEVMGVAVVLSNMQRFGFDTVPLGEVVTTSDLEVPTGTSLASVAYAASIPIDTLRMLNPEYNGDVVPSASFPMAVHLPSATLTRARANLLREPRGSDETPQPSSQPASPNIVVSRGNGNRIFYRVRDGDTFASLAQAYDMPIETIASDNALDATSSLRPGMILALRRPEPAVQEPARPPPRKKRK